MMTLVDTSAWIDFFRDDTLASRVEDLLGNNEVALCGPVVTELTRGFRNKNEMKRTLTLLEGCRRLEQPDVLWYEAGQLGFIAAKGGFTVKTLDLLIACYALHYDIPILTKDADFQHMIDAGIPLNLSN